MRKEFKEIVSGWTLTSDVEDLGEYIEASAEFIKQNPGPLSLDEHKTIEMMVECQIIRGILRGDFNF